MYRVEQKYLCSDYEILLLKQRLAALLPRDAHQTAECYTVRSVYLDTYDDECLCDNENGTDDRSKYRIRIYPQTDDKISFEIKHKKAGKTKKESFPLMRDECEELLGGGLLNDACRAPSCAKEAVNENTEPESLRNRVMVLQKTKKLQPKIIVDYERSAFVYPLGNVRITFDRNIAAGTSVGTFFETNVPLVPVLPPHMHLMEVKYDEFLPDFIAQVLDIGNLRRTTFSKYYICRQATELQNNIFY